MSQMLNSIVAETKYCLHDFSFLCAHRKSPSFFARKTCRLTFPVVMGIVLSLPKAAMQVEINQFTKKFVPHSKSATAAALFKARKKIKLTAFHELIEHSLSQIYAADFKKVLGCRLVAVDGSIFEIPQAARKDFGTLSTRSVEIAKAQVCALYDVENHIILEASIAPYVTNERDEASQLIQQLERKSEETGIENLYIFDRGFPCKRLLHELKHTPYIFRVSKHFTASINQADLPDQIVTVQDSHKEKIELRVLNIDLGNGKTERLFTNILDKEITAEEFKSIYRKRWRIESRYNVLKNLLDIDNFSSADKDLIEQDFYATIFLSNMVRLAQNYADEEIRKKNEKKGLKYEYKTNTNTAISELRPMLIEALMANPLKKVYLFRKILRRIEKSVVPIRPDRSGSPRQKKYASEKHPMNKKGNR